jgi:3-oxoacyl-[acyl-carrier-protein] synthase II
MQHTRRVMITGLGAISPLGLSVEGFWQNLLQGRSGIATIRSFDPGPLPTRIAAEVRDFRPEDYIERRKSIKLMGRHIQMAVAAARQAVEDAGIKPGSIDPTRLGVSMGTGMLHADLDELQNVITASLDDQGELSHATFGREASQHVFPLWLLKYIPNMTASHISIFHDARGPSNTITTLCTSATHAIGEAFWVIQRRSADCMIAGGSDARLNPLSLVKYIRLGLLTAANDPPSEASRPFDLGAQGMVMGEGAGVLVIEELEHARKRGARIYAEVVGYGSGSDAGELFQPHPDGLGLQIAMRSALSDAGIEARRLDWISASAMSIPSYDRAEVQAIRAVCGSKSVVPITAIKSMLGHTHAASGAFGIISGALSLRDKVIPPTINLQKPVWEDLLDGVSGGPRKLTADYALINNAGFGGNNACLILKRMAEQTGDGE